MKSIIRTVSLFVTVFALVLATVPVGAPIASAADKEALSAQECENLKQVYNSQNVQFYTSCAIATTCGGSSTSASAGEIKSLSGDNNGAKIFNFWVSAGMSKEQSAGITASMQNEGGFSPFRQEGNFGGGGNWPSGGWGIAQFTGGQRQMATDYVKKAVGDSLFSQYYSNQYGGPVGEAGKFVPEGVPMDVNDKFLLAELNYLLTYVKGFTPSSIPIRTSGLRADYGQDAKDGQFLYDYLKSISSGQNTARDAAIAWTYLYEQPASVKEKAGERGDIANDVLKMFSAGTGTSSSCGGNLTEGGLDLNAAVKFVNDYKNNADNVKYIGGAGQDCAGGPLSNCVSFSIYFINKYTNLKSNPTPGNGSTVVANLIAANPGVENGHSPRPYAVFSTASGSQMCGSVKCGHTGVILGVDKSAGKVIVGEAACGAPGSWDTAREYPLSQFDSNDYTYIYTDGQLKGDVK